MNSNCLEAECSVNRGYCFFSRVLQLLFCKDVVIGIAGLFKARPFQSLSSSS